jgi:hypothetical protein
MWFTSNKAAATPSHSQITSSCRSQGAAISAATSRTAPPGLHEAPNQRNTREYGDMFRFYPRTQRRANSGGPDRPAARFCPWPGQRAETAHGRLLETAPKSTATTGLENERAGRANKAF